MNPFILSAQDRLAHWKEFRKSLPEIPENEQLNAVCAYWALAPLSKNFIDLEQPETWPSPWEMVSEGEWDRNSIAIGMEFTLRLSGWDADRLKLVLIKDNDVSDIILILVVDNQLVLNYNYSEIVEYPNTNHVVIGEWSFQGKTYASI